MLTMIDCLDGDFGDIALSAINPGDLTEEEMEQLKPEEYKDAFKNPTCFEEAWNHPSPFQRKRWRAAIEKELTKMMSYKVWKKVKRNSIPNTMERESQSVYLCVCVCVCVMYMYLKRKRES